MLKGIIMSNKVMTFGDPITNITEKDFGRVATDKDGVLRIRVQGITAQDEYAVYVSGLNYIDDRITQNFALIGGVEKMYWEDEIVTSYPAGIIEVYGDLLAAAERGDIDAIAHCCNCFCTMGSGIAPKIKSKWPGAFKVDCATKRGDYKKLGTFTKYTENNLTIYNLYGQYGYSRREEGKRDLNYEAIYNALDSMGDDVVSSGGKIVGLPMLGCGLAGGSWNIVKLMIEETLVNKGLNVIVYKLK